VDDVFQDTTNGEEKKGKTFKSTYHPQCILCISKYDQWEKKKEKMFY